MTDLLDSNVLIDVFRDDPKFLESSRRALSQASDDGPLIVGEVVWAEVAVAFAAAEQMEHVMAAVGARFVPTNQQAASLAGAMMRAYRERGGRRERVPADFLVGAHAQTHADRLLTRDHGFYRAAFKHLKVIDPTER